MSAWSQQSVNRRIFSAMFTISAFTLILKFFRAGKEIFVANQFGTQDAIDAYLIAFVLPAFLIISVAGSLTSAFIPTFIRVRDQEGVDSAQSLLSGLTFWTLVVLTSCCLVVGALFPYIVPFIASGFSAQKLLLTQNLFYTLLPLIIIAGLTTLFTSTLNASERFAWAAMIPIATPLLTIAALLLFAGQIGVYALVAGSVVGGLLELVLLVLFLRRQGFSPLPRLFDSTGNVRAVFKQYLPIMMGAALLEGTTFVNQIMAASLPAGSVAALNYGNKLVALVLGLSSYSLSTAVLPHFSKMVASGDWDGLWHTLRTFLRLVLMATVPILVLVVFFSEQITTLLYQRGAFSPEDTKLVATVQIFYFLQLPFFSAGIIGGRLLNALRCNTVFIKINLINLLLCIAGNYLLSKRMGVAGIALSNAVMYMFSACAIFYFLWRYSARVRLNQQ